MSLIEKQPDIDAGKLKGSSLISSSVMEFWVHDFMRPLEDLCLKLKITPNMLTFTGLFLTILAGIGLATGHLIWGGWLVIFAGCFDFFDGRIARRTNSVSQAGAFLDSCLDRYMDAAVLFGLAYYFRNSWFSSIIYLAILGSGTTPYIRAKAESLGLQNSGGAMQRPERIVYIGLGAAFSGYITCLMYPFRPVGEELPPYLLMGALIFVAYMSNKVAIERFWYAYKLLRAKDKKSK